MEKNKKHGKADRTWPSGLATVIAVSLVYGLLAILVDFLLSLWAGGTGVIPSLLMTFRSCGLVMGSVVLFILPVLGVVRLRDRLTTGRIDVSLEQAVLFGSGAFAVIFLWMFNRFYDKFAALVAAEVVGGTAAVVLGWLFYRFLQSHDRWRRPAGMSKKAVILGTVGVLVLFGLSFLHPKTSLVARTGVPGTASSDRANILLIVLDTVRADRLSLYGYPLKTTPFLAEMARESAVFNNAFAASPWTLPSHASLFTGLYPSQHNTHAEHFWLDDDFRTLAEALHDHGYQTVSFSNNDYVTSYHNLVQGFERSWYKRHWTDETPMAAGGLGSSAAAFYGWIWWRFEEHLLARILQNPTAIWSYPTAAETNKAVGQWLDVGRDPARPFFVFINYMDAHLPYNPDEATARLFLQGDDFEASFQKRLRFPSVDACLDPSANGYSEDDFRIVGALYDACILTLDRELEKLMGRMKEMGLLEETLIIITSDHGEYLGTRNRLAHGLGLHQELLHIPLIARYPRLFEGGTRYDTVVTHVDIPETILAFAGIQERPSGQPETQVLYDSQNATREYVFGESRFPLNLLVNAPLREDHSHLFVEQKVIRNRTHKLIWKSRGEPEFYNILTDPLELDDLFVNGREKERFEEMQKTLALWMKALPHSCNDAPDRQSHSKKENRDLLERLRAIGYVN